MQNYKDLLVWQEAHQFALLVYGVSKIFPKEETFGVTSQLRRATVSIPCNIAEGAGRHSSKDFAHFLQIALGSVNETEYLIMLSKDLNYIKERDAVELQEKINKIKAMTIKLVDKVRNKS